MTLDPAEYLTAEAEADRSDGPSRRCAVTGDRRDKATLIRFALDPAGRAIPDIDESLPGRGFWVSAAPGLLAGRAARKRLGRLLGGQALPEDIDSRLERLLLARCVDIIGLARRAGQAVAGWEKLRSDRAGRPIGRPIGLLLTARDAGADGQRRARALAADAGRHLTCLAGAELGQPFGRGSTVHVALYPGRLADRLARDGVRLAAFRQQPGAGDPGAGDPGAGGGGGQGATGGKPSRRSGRTPAAPARQRSPSRHGAAVAEPDARADPG